MIDVLDFAYVVVSALAGLEMGLFFWNLYQNRLMHRKVVRVRHQNRR